MTALVIISGFALLVTALGFLTVISIRIKLDDRRKAYRTLRYVDGGGTLSNSGRRLVGLNFPEQPAVPAQQDPREDDEGEADRQDAVEA